jgi:1-phosphofructokinase family hexose kinase
VIVTLNPNTAIDYTLKVDQFELNTTIRGEACAWGMGGKATDAAWILGKLGEPVQALGFAAGNNGLHMEAMLRERGVKTDFVWVAGETRLNVVIVRSSGGQTTFTAPGLYVTSSHVMELISRYKKALTSASCVVIGGSLPEGALPDFYQEVISLARDVNIPVIFDSSGELLASGLKAQPTLIKPNLDEVTSLLGYKPFSREQIQHAVVGICSRYSVNMILTLGEDGALANLNGRLYWIEPLQVPVESVAGAGDGVLAGMAMAISRKESLEKGLEYGFALAGAIVQSLATADFRREDYEKLLRDVSVVPLVHPK